MPKEQFEREEGIPSKSVIEQESAEKPVGRLGVFEKIRKAFSKRINIALLVGLSLFAPLGKGAVETASASPKQSPEISSVIPRERIPLEIKTQETKKGQLERPGLHLNFWEKDKQGNKKFNPWSILMPLDLELSKKINQETQQQFGIPYEYSRNFDTAQALRGDDFERVGGYFNQQMNRELVDVLGGFDVSKRVYRAYHGEPVPSGLKIVDLQFTGAASPEGPAEKGPRTLLATEIDAENLKLAQLRAENAYSPEQLEMLGLDQKTIKELSHQVSAEEIQLNSSEMRELSVLAQNEPGVDDMERIFNLVKDYNDEKITDQAALKKMDEIMGGKRKVEITVTYEGNHKKVLLIPIPLLLLAPLLFLRRRREKDQTPGPKPKPDVIKPPIEPLPPIVIPPKIRENPFPEKDSREYEEMEEKALIDDLYVFFDKEEAVKRGLDYRTIADKAFNHYQEFKDGEERELFVTMEILQAWRIHDIEARREAGVSLEHLRDGLDHDQQPRQIMWARMHARAICELVERKKSLSPEAQESTDYLEILSVKVKIMMQRRALRLAPELKETRAEEEGEKEKKAEKTIPETALGEEKSLEQLVNDLNEKRGVYAKTYERGSKTFKEVFGKRKGKKKFGEYERTIEPVRKFIEAGDREKLKLSSDNEDYKKANKRRESFIAFLEKNGAKKEQAEMLYETELSKAEYDNAKWELGKKLKADKEKELAAKEGLTKEQKEKELLQFNAELYKTVVLNERDLLVKAKVESWPPQEKRLWRKGLDWYLRRGTATKLLISTGLMTGIVAGAGGFSAPAVAMFAGYRFVRGAGAVLASKLAGKGVDWAMTKGIEAKHEAALSNVRKEFSLENLKKVEKETERIFEEKAKRERKKLYIKAGVSIAAGMGTAIGIGMLERALTEGVATSAGGVSPETHPTHPEASATHETIAKVSSVETAEREDSVWKMLDRQLEKHFGEKYTSLNEAQRTYAIDAYKDQVVAHPQDFGLTNVDNVDVDHNYDFSRLFGEKITGQGHAMEMTPTPSDMPSEPFVPTAETPSIQFDEVAEAAQNLHQEDMENILHNNHTLDSWVHEHPGERLTSEKVNELLGWGGPKVIPDVPFPETQLPEPPSVETLPPVVTGAGAESILVDIERAKSLGFNLNEYQAIQNVKVGKLLEQIPINKQDALDAWGDGEVEMPHHGMYGAGEFNKHFKLARFVRSFQPGEGIKQMNIKQFLQMVGERKWRLI